MKLKSFEYMPPSPELGLSLLDDQPSWREHIGADVQENGFERYELTEVTPAQLKAWNEIAQALSKAGMWLEWTHSMPKPRQERFASLSEFAAGPIFMYDVTITIEHRPGFNMKDYFNDQFRLTE